MYILYILYKKLIKGKFCFIFFFSHLFIKLECVKWFCAFDTESQRNKNINKIHMLVSELMLHICHAGRQCGYDVQTSLLYAYTKRRTCTNHQQHTKTQTSCWWRRWAFRSSTGYTLCSFLFFLIISLFNVIINNHSHVETKLLHFRFVFFETNTHSAWRTFGDWGICGVNFITTHTHPHSKSQFTFMTTHESLCQSVCLSTILSVRW